MVGAHARNVFRDSNNWIAKNALPSLAALFKNFAAKMLASSICIYIDIHIHI